MSESACTALGLTKHLDRLPLYLFVTCNYHLRNALAIGNGKWFGREIHQYNAHLATIVGIYCTRGV
jgi:hypothetical protein